MSAPLRLRSPVWSSVSPAGRVPPRSDVWTAQSLGHADAPVVPTGHAALDAQLPGGGWPVGALVEILQAPPGWQGWSLLLPALAQVLARQPGPVVLVGAPAAPGAGAGLAGGLVPFGPSLRAQGLAPERLLWVCAGPAAARLWATEQALRCADVAAVLAWLPQADSSALRRLQLAAQMHGRLLFVCRPQAAQHEASPARLRLRVEQAAGPLQAGQTAPEWAGALQVHILKRRGPPLEDPLTLTPQPPRLMALLAARRREPGSRALHVAPRSRDAGWVGANRPSVEDVHALDRVAVAAG